MEESDRLRLVGNHEYLVENIRAKDIQDRLLQEFILTEEELEELDRVNSFQATRKLLGYLKKSPRSDSFGVFCSALNDKGYEFAVEKLLATDLSVISKKVQLEEKRANDQIEKLQKQVWGQCEMLIDLKKQLDELKEKKGQGEEFRDEQYSQYNKLERKMKEKGIDSSSVIQLILNYMENGGFSQVDKESTKQQKIKNSAVVESDGDVVLPNSTSLPGKLEKSTPIDVGLAQLSRDLGKDIAFYMVMKKHKMLPTDPPNKYSVVMRKMIDEINEKNEDIFRKLVAELDLEKCGGFQALISVANSLFSVGQNNWGRIVVLYAFAGWMAINSDFSQNDPNSWERIATLGDFVGYYITQQLGAWIEKEGGWDEFIRWFEKPPGDPEKTFWSTLMISGTIGLGVALGITLLKS